MLDTYLGPGLLLEILAALSRLENVFQRINLLLQSFDNTRSARSGFTRNGRSGDIGGTGGCSRCNWNVNVDLTFGISIRPAKFDF